MKNKIVAAVLIILMFVPSAIAVWNYVSQQKGPMDSKNIISMTIDDLTGQQFTFERSDENGAGVIDFFLNMNSSALSISELPEALANEKFFKVTIKSAARESVYKYYFFADSVEGYCLDDAGKAFRIGENWVKEFVTGEYASSLYSQSHVPTLTVSSSSTAAPEFAYWQYKNSEGKFVSAGTDYLVSTQPQTFILEGGISLDFDNKPDFLSVKITDNSTGEEIYNDIYENISSLTLTESMDLSFDVDAKWYEDSTRDYYGELSYKFTASVPAPAAFYMGVESATVGEFVTVTGVNVNNKDNVTFKSEPDIGYTPVFYQDGSSVRTLIPLSYTLDGGQYKFTFTYGGLTQDISLNVKGKTFGTSAFETSAENAERYMSEASLKGYNDVVLPILKTGSDTMLWNGSFLEGCDGALSIGFGRFFSISSTGKSVRHDGVLYKATAGTDVKAVNAGTVVYAGSLDYSGYTVIIEHGYGLKSVYKHLSQDLKVNIGDKVEKGAVIGGCGSTGFVPNGFTGTDISMYVFDVPVCAYPLWDDGEWKGIPWAQVE